MRDIYGHTLHSTWDRTHQLDALGCDCATIYHITDPHPFTCFHMNAFKECIYQYLLDIEAEQHDTVLATTRAQYKKVRSDAL